MWVLRWWKNRQLLKEQPSCVPKKYRINWSDKNISINWSDENISKCDLCNKTCGDFDCRRIGDILVCDNCQKHYE